MAVDLASLKELAELFSSRATLYAVGGFCRDSLLDIPPRDVDVCAEISVDEVKTLLKTSDFVVSDRSYRLGTAVISRGSFACEYTAFRTDSYAGGSGEHRPQAVTFTRDMRLDSERRDFKCNAIYFDIKSGKYVDLLGGMHDIKARVLSATRDPDLVFGEDGLRVLRLARFVAELGFTPDEDTLDSARRNAWRVRDIVRERVLSELDKIFVADCAYPSPGQHDGHRKGFEMLDELGLVEMLLPEVAALKGLPQPKQYHIYDAYRHSVEAYTAAPPEIRWAALLHDIGKRPTYDAQGNMHGHEVASEQLARTRLDALGMPRERERRICELVRWHMVDLKGDMSEAKLRRFIVAHACAMPQLIQLKRADAYASKGVQCGELRIERLYNEMLSDGTPMCIADLPVDGKDAMDAGLKGREIGEALEALLDEAVINPRFRDRERALAFLQARAQRG